MELTELREQIDEIDAKIVELYEKRMEVSRQVAEYKLGTGKKVFDRQREAEKLSRVKALTHNEWNGRGVQELFEQIMSMSRKLQYRLLSEEGGPGRLPFIEVEQLKTQEARVVYQGAEGSYSQAAMLAYFGEQIKSFHVDTFRDAMSAIEEGCADFAVLPIENSTAGIVNEIYDLLQEYENYIVGEQILQVEHCLLALPGTELSDIKTVYSHPQSLMQSARFLEDFTWSQISMQNNAFASEKVAQEQDRTQAAIAGEVLTGFQKFCLAGGAAVALLGVLMLFGAYQVMGVIAIIAGIGMIVYYHSSKKQVEVNQQKIRIELEAKRKNDSKIIRAVLAEVVDFREEFARKDGESEQVLDFLEQLSPDQYIRRLSDSTRRIRV